MLLLFLLTKTECIFDAVKTSSPKKTPRVFIGIKFPKFVLITKSRIKKHVTYFLNSQRTVWFPYIHDIYRSVKSIQSLLCIKPDLKKPWLAVRPTFTEQSVSQENEMSYISLDYNRSNLSSVEKSKVLLQHWQTVLKNLF